MNAPLRSGNIYLVTNLVTMKKYVGCTITSLTKRWGQHLSAARKGSRFALHASMRKHGAANFKVEILQVIVGTHAEIMHAEMRHIHAQQSVAPHGYNLTYGGEGVDYDVPGVRERHLEAMRKLPLDAAWKESLLNGIRKRQANPEYRVRQAEGCRRSGQERRSRNCTRCDVVLTAGDRSWCMPCKKEYHRQYEQKWRKQKQGAQ